MKRIGNWIQFEEGDLDDESSSTTVSPSEIRSVEADRSDGSYLVSLSTQTLKLKSVVEYERLLEILENPHPDPKALSDDDLQHELEFAERRHTRVLAEVARRSP